METITKTFTERLNGAFKELRGLNYIAKQNFLCCQSCGWAAISDLVDGTGNFATGKNKGKPCTGVVFYHRQDTEGIKSGKGGYLAWGPPYDCTSDAITVTVGQKIIDVLSKHGVATEWDGSISQRIKVKDIPVQISLDKK